MTHEMTLREKQLALEHLLAGVADKFRGLHLPRVVGDHHMRPPPDEVSRARIEELVRLIERMGSVNLDAMREHAEAEERFTFYTTQKADLEKALSDLTRAIQQMNRESRRLFEATFVAVNERFREIFPRMFRGGRAELRLTNPEDMLETGIDIVAQPPGKKLSSIELMSGGEKALTAVSLIFAIFQIKPSPFCILDEVDAPLDEANVTRYNDLVRSMTDRSQFILITHGKRTMQMVDVLYGVTMPEAGVSKIVSVKINDGIAKVAPGAMSSQRELAPAAHAPVSEVPGKGGTPPDEVAVA
jgi:chromosome segregation protein